MRLNQKSRIGLVIIGLAVILLIFWQLGRNRAVVPAPGPAPTAGTPGVTEVSLPRGNVLYQARMAIPARSLITAEMLKPIDAQGKDTGPDSLYVTDTSQVVGYITNTVIPPGLPISKSSLVGHLTDVGIGAMLNPGMRAMVVPIPNKATLHDLVKVGDYVDIVAAFDGQESKFIVQNRRVLAVDVFVNDFPQVQGAQRGDYKAAPKGIAASNAPSPASNGQPGNGAPAANGQAPNAPTPTPAPSGPPPLKPEAALTLEVMPEDVTAISLAISSVASLDYVLRPRPAVTTGLVPETRVVSLTKPVLAPYADRMKRTGGTGNNNASKTTRVASNDEGSIRRVRTSEPPFSPPTPWVNPQDPRGLAPVAPPTYNIPIYGDGKITRVDTVRKPEAAGSY